MRLVFGLLLLLTEPDVFCAVCNSDAKSSSSSSGTSSGAGAGAIESRAGSSSGSSGSSGSVAGLSAGRARCSVQRVDWAQPATWPKDQFDVVIGADLVYDKKSVKPLTSCLKAILKPGTGVFLYATKAHTDRVSRSLAAGVACSRIHRLSFGIAC